MSKLRNHNPAVFLNLLTTIFLLPAFSLALYAQKEINKRPLKDFIAQVNRAVGEKKVDLNEPFSIEVSGILSEDGKIVDAKVKTISGKSEIVKIAVDSVASLSDSGVLKYLRDMGCKEILLQISQDEKEVAGIIKADVESEAKAKQIKSGLNLFISIKKQESKDEDEKFFFEHYLVAGEGKTLQLIFRAPREAVQDLMKKNLEKAGSGNAND